MSDTEFFRDQAESLYRLISAQKKTEAIQEAQDEKKPGPKPKQKKKKESNDGRKTK